MTASRVPWPAWLAALLVPLLYALFTGHVWEDYYITFRHSRNLAEGHGLVFVPGERVHGFTSPLGTLLPALLYWLTGLDDLAIWLFRLASALALAASVVVLWQVGGRLGLSPMGRWLVVGLLVLDPKTVDVSMAGMETAFLILFVSLALLAVFEQPGRWWKMGLAWAGLMWTRPDGFVYLLAITGSALLLGCGSRRALTWDALRAGLLCTLIYGPWFAWAWSYYGSPVPHTVVAKSVYHGPAEFLAWFWRHNWPPMPWSGSSLTADLTGPAFVSMGGWYPVVPVFSSLVTLAGLASLARPGAPREQRLVSLAFGLVFLYLASIPRGAWYLPSGALLGALALAAWVDALRWRALAVGLVTFKAVLLLCVAWQMNLSQELVEDGNRRVIGLYLRQHAQPGDTVLCEPLGYIGYFSGLRMLDLPGLVSPRSVAAQRRYGQRWDLTIRELQPDWLVLRDIERQAVSRLDPALLTRDYVLERTFDVRPQLLARMPCPGYGILFFDAHFHLFRRVAP